MSQNYSIEKTNILVTVASWEERYIYGLRKLLDDIKPKKMVLFVYDQYKRLLTSNLKSTRELCEKGKIEIIINNLQYHDYKETWRVYNKVINEIIQDNKIISVDITTMPRDATWTIINIVKANKKSIQYFYHKPAKYSKDWLSRDPGKPRLVYKLSGISKSNADTTLVILSGFDVERSKQLVRFFEPVNLLIGLQAGDQYNNNIMNRQKHKNTFTRNKNIIWFDIDGFSIKKTIHVLQEVMSEYLLNTNVIMSSLGPKINSLALYLYHVSNPKVSLAYTPANEFNKKYSEGYEETICGIV